MGASDNIDNMIGGLDDWRGELLARFRKTINGVSPELQEDWKWGSPTWVVGKANVVSLGAFKEHVKINFFKGAHIYDEDGLFNAGLDAKDARSIDVRQGDKISDAALKRLLNSAVSHASGR